MLRDVFWRQASDNHSASDAEHARFARESAATAIESRMYLLTDVCGTFEALTQRIQMYRDVADAKSSSPKHYVKTPNFKKIYSKCQARQRA
jgi:limonene-1,2-epoxide hydrolase